MKQCLMRMLVLAITLLLASCGKDNFGVSMEGCDKPKNVQKAFQCSTFENKPWFFGMTEWSGFYVAPDNAQLAGGSFLEALIEAKAKNRYVSIGGESPELVVATLEESLRLWEKTKPDLTGLIVQVHSSSSIEIKCLSVLKAMGLKPSFYVPKATAA